MSSFLLETDRLILRELNQDDALEMFLLNQDAEVLKYTGDLPFQDVDEARKFLANYRDYSRNGMGRWGMLLRNTGELIGWCGLKKHEDGRVDLGFRIMKNYWNRGFATEASLACLKYGFETLQLTCIIGRVLPDNKNSIRVLEKIGMKYWKHGPCDSWCDALYYEVSNPNSLEMP
jgi:[ribosomal protein S5]-alanine N-acetyltransferase